VDTSEIIPLSAIVLFFFPTDPSKLALPNKFVQGIEKKFFGLLFLACLG
jgi:hypothetical protein